MKKTIATALFALAAGAASSALAQQPGVELGVLECQIEGGVGLIISSSKDMRCDFQPSDATFAPEPYFGAVNKFGIDIGVTEATTMSWLVLAPSSNIYAPGALAGDYVGASAEASAGIGGGANLLIGGTGTNFTLQPLSLQTQTGLNIAVGVTQFQLRSSSN